MGQTYEPVRTVVGVISGRDSCYLDEIHFDYQARAIRFIGEINGRALSEEREDFIKYSLTFAGVMGFKMIELDFISAPDEASNSEINSQSIEVDEPLMGNQPMSASFLRVNDSAWINEMKEKDTAAKVKEGHTHYILSTYDHQFEVVSLSYELTIL
jgi:hypothetical protein